MDSIKILHCADFHIGASRSGLKNSLKSGSAEIKNTFFKVLDLCKAESVDFLLIAGDLFDTPFPDNETATEIIHAMSQLSDTVIAISPGNHDCACPGSFYLKNSFPENVVVFTSFAEYFDFPDKKTRLFGAAFTDRFERIPLLSQKLEIHHEFTNLCVLHGDIVSGLAESEYNPITQNSIKESGFDYLALGHIHKRSEIKRSGDTFFSYCGCPDGKGFDEDGSRGIYLGTIKKGHCDLSYVELSSRQYLFVKTDISDCDTSAAVSSKILAQLKNEYPDTFEKNLYRISLTGEIGGGFSPNISQIETTLSENLEYVKVQDLTELRLENLEKIANESTLRGIFVQKMLELSKNADSDDAALCRKALKLGLRAFESEVSLSDN
ncbi:MAG: metallophosphoesterase [Clostridia bacterium]|nr:metallophosphoesterase [Clostridia bacterium]